MVYESVIDRLQHVALALGGAEVKGFAVFLDILFACSELDPALAKVALHH